jgi:hypothetical protein
MPPGLLHDSVEEAFLGRATDDPTTHQPGVDVERALRFRVGHGNDDGDQAVIPEPVGHSHRQANHAWNAQHLPDARLAMASRRQIELVRLAKELDNAVEIVFVDRPHVCHHLQRLQVRPAIRRPRRRAGARRTGIARCERRSLRHLDR